MLVAVAVAAPITLALWQARRQALAAGYTRALRQADEILRRSEASSTQILEAFAVIESVGGHDPCSDASLQAMQRADIGSSLIQTIGYVENGVLLCSSLGLHRPGIPLMVGPDVATRGIRRIKANVSLPFLQGAHFIAVQQGHYVAILHKDLVVDPGELTDGLLGGTFYQADQGVVPTRGAFNPTWAGRSPQQLKVTFVDGNYVVAIVRSPTFPTGAVAAVPMEEVNSHLRSLALLLVPVGAATGLLLAWAVHRLAKWQRSLPSVLRAALRRREFFVVYEPVVDVRTGRWVGAEALVRWRRPNGQLMRPDTFIPVAEESGLIEQITEQVLQCVEADTVALFAQHPEFRVSVNLSANDLHGGLSVERVRAFVERRELQRGQLIVEISERGVLRTEVAQQVIRQFREGGVSVAIDDFGTGYSCLSYLASLELDILKIDKSFVDSLGTAAPTSQVALHIIAMAKSLELGLIAEGVETMTQLDMLRQHGVEFAQGYLFSRPLRMDALLEHLEATSECARKQRERFAA
ncbi:MAG: EAL domain-containing protein [Vicinamibacterales bacterium]